MQDIFINSPVPVEFAVFRRYDITQIDIQKPSIDQGLEIDLQGASPTGLVSRKLDRTAKVS